MGTPSHQQLGLGVGIAVWKSFERNKIIMSLDVEEVKRSLNTLETTTTLLNCANCTTKMKMAPWCWLNSKPSWLLWVMKSQRRIVPSFWNPWLVLRMRMVSSLTLPSWTNCAASKSNKPHPRSYQKTFLKKYIISNSSKICVTTSTLGQKHGGPKKPTKNRKYFLGTERHLINVMKLWESEVAYFLI